LFIIHFQTVKREQQLDKVKVKTFGFNSKIKR